MRFKEIKSKISNFWYYNRTMCIVLAVVIVGAIYVECQRRGTDSSDYEISMITARYISREDTDTLKEAFRTKCSDIDGDGKVTVNISTYQLELGKENQDETQIGTLDADLLVGFSGMFITDNPKALCDSTSSIFNPKDALMVSDFDYISGLGFDDLYIMIRYDLQNAQFYEQLLIN